MQEHQSSGGQVFHHVQGLGRNKLIATGDSCEVKGCNSMTVRGRRPQPLLMIAIQITHKQERGRAHFFSLYTAVIDVRKETKIRSSRSGLR